MQDFRYQVRRKRQGAVIVKLSLKKQMIIFFSVAFSLIAIISDNVILSYSVTGFRNQSYEYCRQIVETNIVLLDTYFRQMKDISMIIANDADVIEAVTYRNGTEAGDYPTELYYQRKVTDKIKQIDILGNIETSIIIGDDYTYLYYYGISPKRNFDFGVYANHPAGRVCNPFYRIP